MSMPLPKESRWEDDQVVLLSALNDFLYCPRRAWLHRVEGVFAHTADTLEGSYAHERVDSSGRMHRDGVRIVRGMPLFSEALGLAGKADAVELHPPPQPGEADRPYPVDYKHGRRRKWDNDDVQLCAQAICLEEMFAVPVPAGAIFHVASKRRREVVFDQPLRQAVLEAIAGVRKMMSADAIPPPALRPQCKRCSLRPLCMPEIASDSGRVALLVASLFRCETEGQTPGD